MFTFYGIVSEPKRSSNNMHASKHSKHITSIHIETIYYIHIFSKYVVLLELKNEKIYVANRTARPYAFIGAIRA